MNPQVDFLPDDFLNQYWEKRVFTGHTARLHWLANESAQDFVARYREPMRVFAPGKAQERSWTEPAGAMELLGQGCTLYLVDYHRHDQRCHDLLESLSHLVGARQGRVSIFLSSARSYMPFHWDSLNNFTIQLAGEKTWLLAPNQHEALPAANFAARKNQASSDEHVRPDRRQIIQHVMQPGCLLYVPRGHWHATRTRTASISLSVNIEPDLLADHVAQILRQALIRSPQYRVNLQSESRAQFESAAANLVRKAIALMLDHESVNQNKFS